MRRGTAIVVPLPLTSDNVSIINDIITTLSKANLSFRREVIMQSRSRKPFPTHILVFLLPAFLIYTLFLVYPLFDTLRLSFYDQSVQGSPLFVGFQNFQTLF